MYVQLFNVHVRWLYSFIGFSAKCWAMERILLRLLWLLEQLWWWRLYKKWFASIERVISLWAFFSQLFYIDNYSLFLLCYFCLVECFNWIWTEMLEIKFWHIHSSYLKIFYSASAVNLSPLVFHYITFELFNGMGSKNPSHWVRLPPPPCFKVRLGPGFTILHCFWSVID